MIVSSIWWHLARSSGLVAGVLIVASFIWGIFLATQLVKPIKKPAWLLDLHKWLGTLTVVFVALHLIALVADSYVEFDLMSILVPFTSEWRPLAVTWGVFALYLLAIIQFSSWTPIRSRMSRRMWHSIHLVSFPLLWLVAVHSGAAGTDVGNRLYLVSVMVLVAAALFVVLYRVLAGTGRRRRAARKPVVRAKAEHEPRRRSSV